MNYHNSTELIHNDDLILIKGQLAAVVLMQMPDWSSVTVAIGNSKIYDVLIKDISLLQRKSEQNKVLFVCT